MTAIFSDIHGNSPALRAILDDIASHNVDEIVCLGDVIPGVDPVGCVELLVDADVRCIRGNAEENLCTPNIGGFPWRNVENWEWIVPMFTWIYEALTPDQREIIRSWPTEIRRHDAWLIHDSPADRADFPGSVDGLPKEYATLYWHGQGISRKAEESVFEENLRIMAGRDISKLFIGHTHEPWIRHFPNASICNVGSGGMPLDGDSRPSWVLWDDAGMSIHRVIYDFDAFERIIDSTDYPNLNQHYKDMFRKGIHWRGL